MKPHRSDQSYGRGNWVAVGLRVNQRQEPFAEAYAAPIFTNRRENRHVRR